VQRGQQTYDTLSSGYYYLEETGLYQAQYPISEFTNHSDLCESAGVLLLFSHHNCGVLLLRTWVGWDSCSTALHLGDIERAC
jgi:hypothetical protein